MLTVSKSVFGSFILCIYTHPAAHTERDLNFSQGLDQTCAWVSIVRVKLRPPDLFPEMTKNFSYFCNYCWGYCACHDRAWKLVKKWTGCVELRDWWLHTTRYLKCNDPCLIASWYKTGAIRTRSIGYTHSICAAPVTCSSHFLTFISFGICCRTLGNVVHPPSQLKWLLIENISASLFYRWF